MRSASVTSSAFMCSCIDQPTTCRLYRSMMTARYTQPSAVAKSVSLAQTWFGAVAVKLRASRFGATGKSWVEFVVAMYLRLWRARMPC